MPVLKNQRHERYAQELAKGKSLLDAHEAAGYKRDGGNASRIAAKDSVRQRITELQAETASKLTENLALTKDDILRELGLLATATIAAKDVRANDKRAACVDYARVRGWLIERHEHGEAGEFEAMDDNTLEAWLEKRMESAGMIEFESKTEH